MWLEGEMLSRLRISNFYIATCSKWCHSLSHAVPSPPQNVTKKKSDHHNLYMPNTFVKKATQRMAGEITTPVKNHSIQS